MKPVLADTSFLVSLYDRHEPSHGTCRQIYERLDSPLVTCEPVLMEALHLLRRLPGAGDSLLMSVENGSLAIHFRLSFSVTHVRALLKKYSDIHADFADACLIQMADELDTGDILTLDSDFRHYRWRRNKPFRLLIPLK